MVGEAPSQQAPKALANPRDLARVQNASANTIGGGATKLPSARPPECGATSMGRGG